MNFRLHRFDANAATDASPQNELLDAALKMRAIQFRAVFDGNAPEGRREDRCGEHLVVTFRDSRGVENPVSVQTMVAASAAQEGPEAFMPVQLLRAAGHDDKADCLSHEVEQERDAVWFSSWALDRRGVPRREVPRLYLAFAEAMAEAAAGRRAYTAAMHRSGTTRTCEKLGLKPWPGSGWFAHPDFLTEDCILLSGTVDPTFGQAKRRVPNQSP